MKKLQKLFAIILCLILPLMFILPVYAEETTVATTEETTETTTETETNEDDRLDEIESQLQDILDNTTADDIDNSDLVAWLEDNLGISLAGIGSIILGIITGVLFALKYVRKASKSISTIVESYNEVKKGNETILSMAQKLVSENQVSQESIKAFITDTQKVIEGQAKTIESVQSMAKELVNTDEEEST